MCGGKRFNVCRTKKIFKKGMIQTVAIKNEELLNWIPIDMMAG